MSTVNSLGIYVPTKGKGATISKLSKLKTTISCEDGGMYHQDLNCSQIWIETTWTEDELEAWLYKSKGVDYIGTFQR